MRTKYKNGFYSKDWERQHVAECTPFVVTTDRTGKRGETRPDDEGQIPGTVDNLARRERRRERTNGKSFKPSSHRDSSRRRARHLRGWREQVGEKDVGRWRISVLWRTFLERFETGRPSSDEGNRQKKRAREANASSGRSFDHLGNEMPGNWKSLNAPVCEDAYGNRRCSPSPSSPLPPPSTMNFAFALSWFWIASIYTPNCKIKHLEFIIISKNWILNDAVMRKHSSSIVTIKQRSFLVVSMW